MTSIHPISAEGRTERAIVKFILRDFEMKGLAAKRDILRGLCRGLQATAPRARVRCKIRKQYRNMAYWLRKDMRPVELAREALASAGLKPYDHVIRGGTDGSRLTELGVPPQPVLWRAQRARAAQMGCNPGNAVSRNRLRPPG